MNKPSHRPTSRGTSRTQRRGLLGARRILLAASAMALLGCGAAEPREADIYHDARLRPTVVQANAEDDVLLARLDELDDAGTVQLGGATIQVEAPYPAASGRLCRSIGERLACRSDAGWEFVPPVLPTAGSAEATP